MSAFPYFSQDNDINTTQTNLIHQFSSYSYSVINKISALFDNRLVHLYLGKRKYKEVYFVHHFGKTVLIYNKKQLFSSIKFD